MPTPTNDLAFVRRVLRLFADGGHDVWLFGGWAEELRGVTGSRRHGDVDLFHRAADFEGLDAFIAERGLDEIVAKRFPHKRAVVVDGVMVELFLVQEDEEGAFTRFWGIAAHRWPDDIFDSSDEPKTVSAATLTSYRQVHGRFVYERFHPRVGAA